MTIIQLGSGLAERAGPWTGGGVEGGEGRGVREVYCLYIYALFSLVDWAQSTSQLTNLVLTAKKKSAPACSTFTFTVDSLSEHGTVDFPFKSTRGEKDRVI